MVLMAKWINAHQNSHFVKQIGHRSGNQTYSTELYRSRNHVKLNLKHIHSNYYKQSQCNRVMKVSILFRQFFSTYFIHAHS